MEMGLWTANYCCFLCEQTLFLCGQSSPAVSQARLDVALVWWKVSLIFRSFKIWFLRSLPTQSLLCDSADLSKLLILILKPHHGEVRAAIFLLH